MKSFKKSKEISLEIIKYYLDLSPYLAEKIGLRSYKKQLFIFFWNK